MTTNTRFTSRTAVFAYGVAIAVVAAIVGALFEELGDGESNDEREQADHKIVHRMSGRRTYGHK